MTEKLLTGTVSIYTNKQTKATVNSDKKRDIKVYFINGKFDQLSHMKSGKLDFLSRILCVILDILSFCLLLY